MTRALLLGYDDEGATGPPVILQDTSVPFSVVVAEFKKILRSGAQPQPGIVRVELWDSAGSTPRRWRYRADRDTTVSSIAGGDVSHDPADAAGELVPPGGPSSSDPSEPDTDADGHHDEASPRRGRRKLNHP